ncbi:MAG TPA: C39 family peptidase [Candidatus Limnocylindrales bacterium]|nr:C39 family peptidase [Candidatus Limnocylindrales bacterium]
MGMRPTLLLIALLVAALALPGTVAGVNLQEASGGSLGAPATNSAAEGMDSAQPGSAALSSWSGRFSVFYPRTHSVQKTDYYCVPASIQMMLNIIDHESDKSRAGQDRYFRYAQDHSRYPILDNGADPQGWAEALQHWGAGNYSVGVHSTMQASLKAAAKRMRMTGKPVGLIVWGNRGGHAWVMTGFAADADPAATDSYRVSSIQAMGPLYPYGTIGGRAFDPGPREWVEYPELKKKFTYYWVKNSPAWNGSWITVLP